MSCTYDNLGLPVPINDSVTSSRQPLGDWGRQAPAQSAPRTQAAPGSTSRFPRPSPLIAQFSSKCQRQPWWPHAACPTVAQITFPEKRVPATSIPSLALMMTTAFSLYAPYFCSCQVSGALLSSWKLLPQCHCSHSASLSSLGPGTAISGPSS